MSHSKAELREGRERLARLLEDPEVLRLSREMIFRPTSPLGQEGFRGLRRENLDALVVYVRPPGRWYADLVLRDRPAGLPLVLGTPIDMPLPDLASAEAAARGLAAVAIGEIDLAARASRDTAAADLRVFALGGVTLDLPGALVDLIAAAAPRERDAITEDRARLDDLLVSVGGAEKLDRAAWEAADPAWRVRVASRVAFLLARGECTHPPRDIPGPAA